MSERVDSPEVVGSPELAASSAVAELRSPQAVRERSARILAAGRAGQLRHFTVDDARLPVVADRVVEVTLAAYPDLDIPVHGRLAHFASGGVDRVGALLHGLDQRTAAAALIDLVLVSVLLDAGAGDAWRFREPEGSQLTGPPQTRHLHENATGATLSRSEGLAVASLHAFVAGRFSARPDQPLRVDAAVLEGLTDADLASIFQVTPENPMVGLTGRARLLRRLGAVLAGDPARFPGGRPAGLISTLTALSSEGAVPAPVLLTTLLDALAPIWPGRIELDGQNLGDVWRHPAAGGDGRTAGLMPFHKLTQWLAYSLFEPLALAGLRVSEPQSLTGLPEYRNGGLLIDLGLIVARHPGILTVPHEVGSEVVVEWRALTVALLDDVAREVRHRVARTEHELPLARILQGGTWAAGRQVARELRPDGSPPLKVISDGTVF